MFNKLKIDLHTHSYFSDGEMSPKELINYAKLMGIGILSLTDHDTVEGIDQAQEAADEIGVHFIPGVEISVSWRNMALHIVGLNINHKSIIITDLLKQQFKTRVTRAKRIADKLDDLGVDNAYDKAAELARGGLITRPHFAQVLIDDKICKDMKTAFKKYLKRGKPAFVQTNWVDLPSAIQAIKEAGGVAVLAHPMRYKLTRTKLHELVEEFKEYGGEAIEAISGLTNNNEISMLSALCANYDLVASVGSDFHGIGKTPHTMRQLKVLPETLCPVIDKILRIS